MSLDYEPTYLARKLLLTIDNRNSCLRARYAARERAMVDGEVEGANRPHLKTPFLHFACRKCPDGQIHQDVSTEAPKYSRKSFKLLWALRQKVLTRNSPGRMPNLQAQDHDKSPTSSHLIGTRSEGMYLQPWILRPKKNTLLILSPRR